MIHSFTHCCVHANWTDILRVNLAKNGCPLYHWQSLALIFFHCYGHGLKLHNMQCIYMCFWRGCRVSVGQTVRGDGGSATQVPSCRSRWPKHGALLPWLLCNINCFKLLTFGNLAAMLSSTSRLEQVVLLNWSSHFSCLHLVSPPSYALQPARYGHPLLKLQLVEAAA